MKNLTDFIFVIPNAMPHELCDMLLEEYQTDAGFEPARVGNGLVFDALDDNIRRCEILHISEKNVMQKNAFVRERLDMAVFGCVANALKYYQERVPTAAVQKDLGYDLLRYKEGGFFAEHIDSSAQTPRAIACSFGLNEGFDGGEFAFFDGEYVVRVPKGSAVLFPSNFMYPHAVTPVSNGVRYSIVTWFF